MLRVRPRRAAAVLAAAVPLLLLPVLAAAPASAHDELVSVTPRQDAVLAAAPTEVVLVFSDAVEQLGATVVATAGDGTSLVDGSPAVDGSTVTQSLLPIDVATTVTVKYRVVSSDGHPVTGSWTFQVDLPASLPPSASPSSSAPSEPAPASPSASDAAGSPAASDDGGSGPSGLLWPVLGVLAVGVVAALVVRGRQDRRG